MEVWNLLFLAQELGVSGEQAGGRSQLLSRDGVQGLTWGLTDTLV